MPIYDEPKNDPKYSSYVNSAKMALRFFYNQAAKNGATYTYDSMIAHFNNLNPDFVYFFGQSVQTATPSLGTSGVMEAMEDLADTVKGALPQQSKQTGRFQEALIGSLTRPNMSQWAKITTGALKDTAIAAISYGESLGTFYKFVLPIAGIALIYAVYRRIAGKKLLV